MEGELGQKWHWIVPGVEFVRIRHAIRLYIYAIGSYLYVIGSYLIRTSMPLVRTSVV